MTIRRSTLCGWLQALASLATPLVMRMKFLVLQSAVIHTDDTSIKMLQPGKGVALTAKFWPYLGDWLHPYAVYDFTLNRERDGPQKFLEDFEGYLQADAYSGYDCIYASEKVHEVACWVHARRYWRQALDSDPLRANTALGFIARLSQVESQLRQAYPATDLQGTRDFASVARGRQEHSVPILEEFKTWLDRELDTSRFLPKRIARMQFGESRCQSFNARWLEPMIEELVLQALEPASVELAWRRPIASKRIVRGWKRHDRVTIFIADHGLIGQANASLVDSAAERLSTH